MNNEIDKKNVVKKKNRRSSTYELELSFKNNIKNNKSRKNNRKKYKDTKDNTLKITKILVNDEMISETSIKKSNEPLIEEVTLVKKTSSLVLEPVDKKTKKVDKKNLKSLRRNSKENGNNNSNLLIKKDSQSIVDENNIIKKKKFSVRNLFNKKKKDNDKVLNKNKIDKPKIEKVKVIENNKKQSDTELTLKEISKNIRREKRKKYLKESLIFTFIILIINIILYFTTDYISILRLFDIKYLNIIITIFIIFILLFIGSFLLDYLISEILIKLKNKIISKRNNKTKNNNKPGGDSYRNQRIKQGKYQENIKAKK